MSRPSGCQRHACAAPRAWLWAALLAWAAPGVAQAEPTSCAAPEDSRHTTEAGQPPDPPEPPSCADAGRQGVLAVAFAWTVPHLRLERPLSRSFRYAPHPYADAQPGLLRFGDPVPHLRNPRGAYVARCAPDSAQGGCARRRSTRQRGELELGGGVLTEGAATARALVRVRTRVRLEPSVEVLARLPWAADGPPRALLGHYSLDYRFAQSPRWLLRSGLGGLTFSDAGGTRAGGYLDYAAEWFPGRPWTLEAQAAVGGLAGAFYGRLQLTAGVVLHRVELRLGYDHLSLRGSHITRLSGPRLTLRLWL